jgi:hypothetical protein
VRLCHHLVISGVGTTERIPQTKFEEIMNWMERQIQILSQAPLLSPEQENVVLVSLDI